MVTAEIHSASFAELVLVLKKMPAAYALGETSAARRAASRGLAHLGAAALADLAVGFLRFECLTQSLDIRGPP